MPVTHTNHHGQLIELLIIKHNKSMTKQKKGYKIIDRESEIDNLIMWISETKRESDKDLMKEDLKELMAMTCKNVYSSDETNNYIAIDD